MLSFSSWILWSSLWSLLWTFSQVDFPSPCHLKPCLLGFYFVPSAEIYSPVSSLCLNCCVYFCIRGSLVLCLSLGGVDLCRRYLMHPNSPLSYCHPRPRGQRIPRWSLAWICEVHCRLWNWTFLLLCLPPGGWGSCRGLGRLCSLRDQCLPTGGWNWVLAPWWAGPCLGACLEATVGSGDGCPCLDCCLAWGVPAGEPTGCWVGPDLGAKVSASRRAHRWLLPDGYHQCPYPQGEPESPPPSPRLSPGDAPRLSGESGAGSYQMTALPLVPVHVRFCMCPLRVKSLFPNPVELVSSSPTDLQNQRLPGSSSWCRALDWGAWGGARNSHSCGRVSEIEFSPVCGTPTQGVRNLIVSCTHPSWISLVAQTLKNPPAMQETWVKSLGWKDPLEKEQQPTPVFLPGKPHGQRNLVGYSPWGCRIRYDWVNNTFIPPTHLVMVPSLL